MGCCANASGSHLNSDGQEVGDKASSRKNKDNMNTVCKCIFELHLCLTDRMEAGVFKRVIAKRIHVPRKHIPLSAGVR